jgi:hypothetical protein
MRGRVSTAHSADAPRARQWGVPTSCQCILSVVAAVWTAETPRHRRGLDSGPHRGGGVAGAEAHQVLAALQLHRLAAQVATVLTTSEACSSRDG